MNKSIDILGEESSYTTMSPKEKEYFIELLKEEIEKRKSDAKFEQIRDIIPIEEWINSPYHVGPDYDRIYSYWKDVIVDVFDGNRTIDNKINLLLLSGCFTGDTKVSLLDGREMSFLELIDEFGMDTPFWVYSCDSDGNVCPGRAHSVHKTKVNQRIFCVELDNGEIIRCTPDHRFMLRDGSYEQAQNLKEGQSLMPLYREYKCMGKRDHGTPEGYERVYNPADGIYKVTHKLVSEHFNTEEINEIRKLYGEDCVVVTHHLNFNKRDNTPSNLKPMECKEHYKFHVTHSKMMFDDPILGPVAREKLSKHFREIWNDPEIRSKMCEARKKYANTPEYLEGHWADVMQALKVYMNSEEGKELSRNNIYGWNHNRDSYESSIHWREHISEGLKVHWNSGEGLERKKKTSERISKFDSEGHARHMSDCFWGSEKGDRRKEELVDICRNRNKERTERILKERREYYDSKGITKDIFLEYVKAFSRWSDLGRALTVDFDLDRDLSVWSSMNTFLHCYDIFDDREDITYSLGAYQYKYKNAKYEYKNHKVAKIYWSDVCEDVYDLEVDEYHNFALSSGVFVHNSIGIGKSCLSETTRIPTTLGLLPLKTLYKEFHENGKRFKVMSESGLRECTDVYDNGVDDTKIIKFKSGREIEGTSKHKIRVIRDGIIKWVEFGDLRVGDKTLMKLEEHPFGNLHMNPDEAYTIGYMVGDGWCEHSGAMYSKNKFSSFQVMFQYENTEVARKICQAYYNWFGRKGLKHRVKKVSNGNHMVYLRAFNAERATKLVNSGFGSGARNKGVPSFIFRCDKETVSNFIQGLFDSDGTAEKGGFTYITMMSKECIYDLGRLISMFGIDYQIKEKDSFFGGRYMGKCYQLSIIGTDSYIKFEEEIGFNIDYKSQRLREKIERSKSGNNRNNRIIVPDGVKVLRELDNKDSLGNKDELHNFTQFRIQDNYTLLQLRKLYDIKEDWVSKSDYLKYICENDVGFDEIVEISDGRCHTYDLTVDNDHSYCFNGFISHNTCAELVVLRKLYEMSCYRNINAMYNLMRQASIMFFYFSVNKTQAERTGFGAIRNLIDSVPYFNEYFKRKDRIDSLLVFPENIQIAFGSGSNDMIGMNSITSILDEANFIGGRDVGNVEKASALFTSIVNRSNSRFIINGGENHSLNILVSSATTENSVTELVMGQNRDNPHAYICAPAQWEVKPDKFSKKYFFVCKGTEHLEPHVVHSTDDINNFRLAEGVPKEKFVDNLTEFDDIDREIQKLPPHLQSKFLKVPEDLRTGFETNIIRSLQDMGGVSTGSTGKLFTSMSVYKDCIDERFVHPFTANEIVLSTGDTIQIKDYLRTSFRLKHPERPRFIHIDQSYRTDSTGITCGYVDNVIVDEQTGMKKPVIGVDFMLRINPPSPPRKIAIYKIRNFIVWLGTAFGMKIGKVTYDIFNSEESRQILEEMGFNVGYQSVDRTDKAYLDLVEIMYEGRFKTYDYPIFKYELFNLVHYRDKRKVDHLKTISNDASAIGGNSSGYSGKGAGQGSKDVSDSVAGMIENILQFSISEESGGYQNNIDDFLYVNKLNGDFEFDAMSAEDLIDKQIDNMIEEFEYSGDITTGGYIDGTQSWF